MMAKRFGIDLKRIPVQGVKGVTINDQHSMISENDSLYTKQSNTLQTEPIGGDDSTSDEFDYHHNHHNSVFYDIYANKIPTTVQSDCSSNATDKITLNCNICNTLNDNKNFIILSCCNDICHIKCLINKLNVFDNSNSDYNEFNENVINTEFFNKLQCLKCNKTLNHEDVFNLYSKHILNNKKYISEYDKKITSLKEQKKMIENEIKCLNEYITKLQSEKQISQVIMSKAFILMTS